MAVYMHTETDPLYVGATLARFERNGYDDSDFYAIVWDREAKRIRTVEYDTTRFSGGGRAVIDATHDVIAEAEAWQANVIEQTLTREFEADALLPKIGRRVRSLTTRGRNVGVEGIIDRDEENKFRQAPRGGYNEQMRHLPEMRRYRVVTDDRQAHWLSGDRVAVVNPAKVDRAEIRRRAEALAKQHRWRLAL